MEEGGSYFYSSERLHSSSERLHSSSIRTQ